METFGFTSQQYFNGKSNTFFILLTLLRFKVLHQIQQASGLRYNKSIMTSFKNVDRDILDLFNRHTLRQSHYSSSRPYGYNNDDIANKPSDAKGV